MEREVNQSNTPPQTVPVEIAPVPNIAPPEQIGNSVEASDHLSQPASLPVSGSQLANESESETELFERIFGRSQNATAQQISVPFLINDQLQGQLFVLTPTARSPVAQLQAALLLEKLEAIVRPDILQALTASIDGGGYLSLDTLQRVGMQVSFDERRLEVRIQVPPALRQTTVNTLGSSPPGVANALPPSRVSGYLNFRGREDFAWSGNDEHEGRQPLNLSVDGALNVQGWVLEGSADFAEAANPSWSRGEIRLVWDDPDHAMRYALGDQIVPTRGYQSSLPILGFSAVRNFSLQPYQITRPISQFEFFLERPSTVDVLINDRPSQTLHLPAGPQDIRDLPLNAGINDVQLVITDDLGRVQHLSFPAAIAADQLAPGVQQFAYSLGFPSSTENGSRSYQWDQPTLTLSHRWGVSDNLTLGGYLQANPDRQLLGYEGVWATSLGNLGWDVAVSHDSERGVDGVARLVYELLQIGNDNPSQRSLHLALEYRGANFTPLDDFASDNPYSLDISANYGQKIFWDLNASLNGRYQMGRDDTRDAYSLELGLSRSFNQGLSVNLNLSAQHIQDGSDEQRASINLFWLFPQRRQSVIATADVSSAGNPTAQVAWNFDSARTVERLNGSVSLSTNRNSRRLAGQLNYTGYRANLGFSQDLLFSADNMTLTDNISHLTFGTALVFADGHFGWSRPVNNSFALVARRGNLQGRTVGINPTGNGYTARADALGPAVVSDLQPYYVSTLQIEVPDLPAGYDIGTQRYSLLPTYRSGTIVYVGTEATVFLRGTIVDPQGGAIALQTAVVVSLSDPDWQPVTIFTNRAGRFAATGFKPGQYELRLGEQTVQFTIPEGQEGVYDIELLTLS